MWIIISLMLAGPGTVLPLAAGPETVFANKTDCEALVAKAAAEAAKHRAHLVCRFYTVAGGRHQESF